MPSKTIAAKTVTANPTTVEVADADPTLYSRIDRARVWARGLTNEYDVPGMDSYRNESGLASFVQSGKVTKKAASEAGRLIAVIEDRHNSSNKSYAKRQLENYQRCLENLDETIADEIAQHEAEIERLRAGVAKRQASLEASVANYEAAVAREDDQAQTVINRAVEVRGAILEELAKSDTED